MKDYVAENERILNKWRKKFVEDKKNDKEYSGYKIESFFAKDGIMFKGDFEGEWKPYDNGQTRFRWKRNPNFSENELWANAPLRILYLTKDQNINGDDLHGAWDVRSETFRYPDINYKPEYMCLHTQSTFVRNLVYSLYGIMKTTADSPMKYNGFSNEEALEFADKQIFARINCKKEAGGPKISDKVLGDAIKKYYKYLKEQILNLDADILICCGNQNDNNLILNTVYDIYEDEFEYVNCADGKGTGMHYNAKRNKLAIDAYHLSSLKGGGEARYNEIVGMYYEFLKYLKKTKDIDFSASHR